MKSFIYFVAFFIICQMLTGQVKTEKVDTTLVDEMMKKAASLNYTEDDFNKMKLHYKNK